MSTIDLSVLQPISQFAAAIGVCVAAIYYVLNLRISQRNQELSLKTQQLALKAQEQNLETRQAQLYMSIYQSSYSPEYMDSANKLLLGIKMESVDDWEKIFRDPEEYRAFYIFAQRLEGMGVLVRQGLLDIGMVSLLESGMISWWWDKYGAGVLRVRQERNFPRYMIELEYLAKRVADYGKEHPELGITAPRISTQ